MNLAAVQSFDFEGVAVRMVQRAGAPWWVVADLARAMGLSNSRKLAGRVDAEDRALVHLANPNLNLQGVSLKVTPPEAENEPAAVPSGAVQIVNESGLYTILLRSDAAMQPGTLAYRFRRWVTADVLPAIRKNGRYDLKPLSPRQRERLWQEHRAVRRAVRAASDPHERRFEHARLVELCADLGLDPPPLEECSAEDHQVTQFWLTVDAAMAAGLLENHHRRPALLAFRGGDLATALNTLKAG
ncbi:MAG: BRO family protein, partial [Sphingomonadales bacterium]